MLFLQCSLKLLMFMFIYYFFNNNEITYRERKSQGEINLKQEDYLMLICRKEEEKGVQVWVIFWRKCGRNVRMFVVEISPFSH